MARNERSAAPGEKGGEEIDEGLKILEEWRNQ